MVQSSLLIASCVLYMMLMIPLGAICSRDADMRQQEATALKRHEMRDFERHLRPKGFRAPSSSARRTANAVGMTGTTSGRERYARPDFSGGQQSQEYGRNDSDGGADRIGKGKRGSNSSNSSNSSDDGGRSARNGADRRRSSHHGFVANDEERENSSESGSGSDSDSDSLRARPTGRLRHNEPVAVAAAVAVADLPWVGKRKIGASMQSGVMASISVDTLKRDL